jgi:hypothetical protein
MASAKRIKKREFYIYFEMESLCGMFAAMSISLKVPNDLVVDEVSYEVKNVCDLMNAVFFEAVVCEIRRLLKEKCPGCEVDHPSQRRHDCIMLSDEEGWLLHGLEAVERVIERGIVRKQFLEAIRVMKLEYYERAKEHYANLIKDREVTLDYF